jgi:DNA polymerase elongation subunit (family B)
MLVDFEYRQSNLVVSYIAEDGSIKMKHYPWKRPRNFGITTPDDHDKHPHYKTWDGRPVKWQFTSNPDRYAVYEYLDRLDEEEQELIFGFQEPQMFFMDIETEIVDTGFVEPVDATTKVQTISIVCGKKVLLLGLKPINLHDQIWIKQELLKHFEKLGIEFEMKYLSFHNTENPEYEMLHYLFTKLIPKMPVITGWNFVNYDWVFLTNRCRRLGIEPELASFTKKLTKSNRFPEELPYHRLIVDYMDLYNKWDTSIKIKESSSLDYVGEKILNIPKVSYTGSLQDLYVQDFKKYLFYNAADSVIVQAIHNKMKYINVVLGISNLSRIRMIDAFSTLATTEGMLRRDFREKKNIVFCKDFNRPENLDKVLGGYVKFPIQGMNKWVAIFDFASLYPTTQMQNNIAPEGFKGIRIDEKWCGFNGKRSEILPDDIVLKWEAERGPEDARYLVEGEAIFSREASVTVEFLSNTYAGRQKYKKQMMIKKEELNKKQAELKELENLLDLS